MILVAFVSFYLVGTLAALFVIAFPHKLTDRGCNAISACTLLCLGWLTAYILALTVGLFHLLVTVPVILAATVFAFGYLTPKWLRGPVEKSIDQYLAYLEFTGPNALLPCIRAARFVLAWLGLAV